MNIKKYNESKDELKKWIYKNKYKSSKARFFVYDKFKDNFFQLRIRDKIFHHNLEHYISYHQAILFRDGWRSYIYLKIREMRAEMVKLKNFRTRH